MKKLKALKLSKETLRTLSGPVLSDIYGGRTTACTAGCPTGTICSCGQTELSCWDSCGVSC